MYTGTCALYDMHNPVGDGNGGWTCYDRVRLATEFAYERSQGICQAPTGNKLKMWRHQSFGWCKNQCDHDARCQSFLFAEGDRHMYSGTCELFDAANPTADGNGGWACYNKKASPAQYTHHQGICNAPRGVRLGMWRRQTKQQCQAKCDNNSSCHSYLFGEGAQHMYTGTCELYDANNPGADGNGGWSCYDRQEITTMATMDLEEFDMLDELDMENELLLF